VEHPELVFFAVAAAAFEHGATVFVTSSKKDNVDSALATLKSSYPGEEFHCRIAGAAYDLGSPETLESNLIELFEAAGRPNAAKEIQPIDHIVFTAGDLLKLVPLSESMAESILASGVVRFLAPLLIGKLAPQYMSVSNRSSITLTSGSMARRPEQH
jgi:NAD(P)-dependent dehydrogenase (short-subunit alcohol dehydrogenase family)